MTTASTTMTIRLSPDLKEKLGQLAASSRRSRSFLATEALSAWVERELEITRSIERGLDDVQAGRVVSHDAAIAEINAVLDGKA